MINEKIFLLWRLEQASTTSEIIRLGRRLRCHQLTEQEDIEIDYYTNTSLFEDRAYRLINKIAPKAKPAERAVIHVHTPKAVGTSLNRVMYDSFYEPQVRHLIPRNSTPRLLRFAFRCVGTELPYLATGHISLKWLLDEDGVGKNHLSQQLEILVPLRPVDSRLNSMRNQILMSVLLGTFGSRPYAYRMPLNLQDLANKYLFPITKSTFCNPMCAALGWDASELPSKILDRIIGVPTTQLAGFIKQRYGVSLTYESKNRTVNLSRFLPSIPREYSSSDHQLHALLNRQSKKLQNES
jgi:hypothetical protein